MIYRIFINLAKSRINEREVIPARALAEGHIPVGDDKERPPRTNGDMPRITGEDNEAGELAVVLIYPFLHSPSQFTVSEMPLAVLSHAAVGKKKNHLLLPPTKRNIFPPEVREILSQVAS